MSPGTERVHEKGRKKEAEEEEEKEKEKEDTSKKTEPQPGGKENTSSGNNFSVHGAAVWRQKSRAHFWGGCAPENTYLKYEFKNLFKISVN